jgi:hypothetical protein
VPPALQQRVHALEGLSVHQTDADFNATLKASIQGIYEASIA